MQTYLEPDSIEFTAIIMRGHQRPNFFICIFAAFESSSLSQQRPSAMNRSRTHIHEYCHYQVWMIEALEVSTPWNVFPRRKDSLMCSQHHMHHSESLRFPSDDRKGTRGFSTALKKSSTSVSAEPVVNDLKARGLLIEPPRAGHLGLTWSFKEMVGYDLCSL